MQTLQPSALRPFTISLCDLDTCDYFFALDRGQAIRDLRAKLDADSVTYQFSLYGHHGTIIIIDGEDLTGEELEESPEYRYLTSIL